MRFSQNLEDATRTGSISHFLKGDIVKIEVGSGDQAEEFLVHKDLLCSKVQYFDNIFNGPFREAREFRAALPADDPAAFHLFVDWLYSGGLLRILVQPTLFETRPYYMTLMKLFYFAEKFFIPVLPDLVMDALIGLGSHFKALPGDDIMDEGYANTKPKSMLRLYLARAYAHRIIWDNGGGKYTPERLQAVAQKHPDLLADFLDIVVGDQKVFSKAIRNPNEAPRCDYHDHGDNEECVYNYSGSDTPGAVQEPDGGSAGNDDEDGSDGEDHYSAPDSGVIDTQNYEDDDGIQVGASAASYCCAFKMHSARRGMQ